jgi:hypothetical protein
MGRLGNAVWAPKGVHESSTGAADNFMNVRRFNAFIVFSRSDEDQAALPAALSSAVAAKCKFVANHLMEKAAGATAMVRPRLWVGKLRQNRHEAFAVSTHASPPRVAPLPSYLEEKPGCRRARHAKIAGNVPTIRDRTELTNIMEIMGNGEPSANSP